MKPLNTLPIEQFLDKARIAIKSNQRNLTLDIKEIQALSDSLAIVMTRLSGKLDAQMQVAESQPTVLSINMDGGGFR